MLPSLTTQDRDAARFMTLDGEASSDKAQGLIVSLATGFATRHNKTKPTSGSGRAIAAILCDFLRAAETDPTRWSYRSLRRESFTGKRIGYRIFTDAVAEMVHHQMLDIHRGHQQWTQSSFGPGPRVPAWRVATRLRPTPWLLRVMSDHGVTPDNWANHFTLIDPPELQVPDPIVCRRGSIRVGGQRYRGFTVSVDATDTAVATLKNRMDKLNGFLFEQAIEPIKFRGLRRIFAEGDASDFHWNKGGRLYAVGGSYQTSKPADRAAMTINGEPVTEVDVRASYLTVLYGLLGVPFDTQQDPYAIEGLPREVVKKWVQVTLGHSGFHRRWPTQGKADLETALGASLSYPINEVREAVVARHPVLSKWEEIDIRWPELQFAESEAMMKAMEVLAFDFSIPTLPVHDSLIVPESKVELATQTIEEAYQTQVGVRPYLK